MADVGRLKVQCFGRDDYIPVDGAKITIKGTGAFATTRVINLTTNSSGLTEEIEVDAPPLEYSQEPSQPTPYSLYDLRIDREGFQTLVINGVQIFPGQTAIKQCQLIK